MIKNKLTKKIDEILGRRDSIEMAFTKGFKTASGSKFSHSKLNKENNVRENKLN